MLIHRIDGAVEPGGLGASSKLNAEWSFLQMLHDRRRRAADACLAHNFDQIGNKSTLDLDALLS